MTVVVILNLFVLSIISYNVVQAANVCPENTECVPLSQCQEHLNGGVLYPCKHKKYVCCPRFSQIHKIRPTTRKYEPFNTIKTTDFEEKIHFNEYFNEKEQIHSFPNNHVSEKLIESTTQQTYEFVSSSTINADHNQNRPIFKPEWYTGTSNSTGSTEKFEQNRLNIPDTSWDNRTTQTNNNDSTKEETTVVYYDDQGQREGSSNIVVSRPPFKKKCGLTIPIDKITGGQVAEPGQFPWMALLGFRQAAVQSTQFLCGGSLITTKHVLTAAHCIIENRPLELILVRLGEYDLGSPTDCVQFGKQQSCTDPPENIPVDSVVVHPGYQRKSLRNDIAIIKLRREVRESEYIRTVCLPFDRDLSTFNFTGQNLTVSGWGKLNSGDLFGSNVLQYAKVQTWDPTRCNDSIPTDIKPLSPNQLCANGPNTEDACKGDSGGPLINITLDRDAEIRSIQFGIVSFGTTTCGDKNLPTVYTRVDKYLQWIVDNVT